MVHLHRTLRNKTLAESRQRRLESAAVESANEGSEGEAIDQISLTAGYVKWDFIGSYFSGLQAALSGLIEAWQRRKSRRT